MTPADHTHIDAEQQLRQAITTGRLVDLRTGQAEADDPAQGATWDQPRAVRAELLAELLTQPGEGTQRARALRLAGARITGTLDLEGAELVCPLALSGCWFDEPVILDEAQAVAIRLPGCHVPGLQAAQLVTRGNLELNAGFTARGEVNLVAAHIGGILSFTGATLTNPDGHALTADGLTVNQAMFCRGGFTAQGEVNLLGAHIGGQLSFMGATLTNPDGHALTAEAITVDNAMLCSGGFTAQGKVNLVAAHIRGTLSFDGATLTNSDGLMLDLEAAHVGVLFLRPATVPSRVDLTNATAGVLADDQATWPKELRLVGFTYNALYEPKPVSAKRRLGWLCRDPDGYSPQPYEQLAAVYRRAGREEDARRVALEKQRQRRRTLSWPARLWSLLLGALVGHGYRTWYAAGWLLLLLAVGTLVYQHTYPAQMIPAKQNEPAPAFQPLVYALDVLLPVVDFSQQVHWIPQGLARWWTWASILAGWVLTTAVVAALTGLLKRE